MNLPSDLQNFHFEILTFYHLWPNTSAIKKFQKHFFSVEFLFFGVSYLRKAAGMSIFLIKWVFLGGLFLKLTMPMARPRMDTHASVSANGQDVHLECRSVCQRRLLKMLGKRFLTLSNLSSSSKQAKNANPSGFGTMCRDAAFCSPGGPPAPPPLPPRPPFCLPKWGFPTWMGLPLSPSSPAGPHTST